MLRQWGAICLHWQLDFGYWLAKLTLLRINPQRGRLKLNVDICTFHLLFAWKNSVINPSLVCRMLSLYWLIKRHYPVLYWVVKYYNFHHEPVGNTILQKTISVCPQFVPNVIGVIGNPIQSNNNIDQCCRIYHTPCQI